MESKRSIFQEKFFLTDRHGIMKYIFNLPDYGLYELLIATRLLIEEYFGKNTITFLTMADNPFTADGDKAFAIGINNQQCGITKKEKRFEKFKISWKVMFEAKGQKYNPLLFSFYLSR